MSLKRMESRKPHSWWWDSYISPKNSRWLADNLDEMEQAVKRMMKLIEEDGDSFAKKAEMYYRKRPELVSHVEEFYRRYRSLAERYDHLTGDLKKNIACDLQPPNSGVSDAAVVDAPAPDLKLARRRSGQQAAGFDFFLGSGISSENFFSGGDESSCLTDSEADFDSSSVYNGDLGFQVRVTELENELHELKERTRVQSEELLRLKDEVRLYESQISDPNSLAVVEEVKTLRIEVLSLKQELDARNADISIRSAEKNKNMMEQLEAAVRDGASWKTKFNAERREVGKLQERMLRLKASLSDRDHEVRELKIAVSDAEEKIFPEKAQIKAEISRLVEERGVLEAQLREWESQGRFMHEEIRRLKAELSGQEENYNVAIENLRKEIEEEISSKDDEIVEINTRLNLLQVEYEKMADSLRSRIGELEEEIKKQRIAITEGAEEKREAIRQLCFSLEHYRNGYDDLRGAILSRKQYGRHIIAA